LGLGPGQVTGQPGQQGPADDANSRHGDHEGDRPRKPVDGPEFVESEGADGGDGAVGEVEDAGRPVGEHEADPGQPVDRAARQSDDDEGEEVFHGRHTSQAVRPSRTCSFRAAVATALPCVSGQSGRWKYRMPGAATSSALAAAPSDAGGAVLKTALARRSTTSARSPSSGRGRASRARRPTARRPASSQAPLTAPASMTPPAATVTQRTWWPSVASPLVANQANPTVHRASVQPTDTTTRWAEPQGLVPWSTGFRGMALTGRRWWSPEPLRRCDASGWRPPALEANSSRWHRPRPARCCRACATRPGGRPTARARRRCR